MSCRTRKILQSLKVAADKSFKSGVAYKLLCPCCQACYVGQTDHDSSSTVKSPKRSGNISDYLEHPLYSMTKRMSASFTLLPGLFPTWRFSKLSGYKRFAQSSTQKTNTGVENSPSSFRKLIFLVACNFQKLLST